MSLVARAARRRLQALGSLLLQPPYSVLSILSDGGNWVLDREAAEICRVARRLGIRAHVDLGLSPRAPQCAHYTSQFVLGLPERFRTRQRVSIDYFHGRPGTTPEFSAGYEALRRHHAAITRLRVAHSEMEAVVLESGIDAAKVRRLPIAVNLELFPRADASARAAARRALGLPDAAVVVGSFQKDGVGWGEGLEPKPIKGPDVLLRSLELLKDQVGELWALLTGPARGYVKSGLARLGIRFVHRFVPDYRDMAACYHALDAYLISSRDEGGPKAVLEAMASGVPLVTTRVGQARDLVRHGENGYLMEPEDAAGLAEHARRAITDSAARARLIVEGRRTAEANSYEAQLPLWAELFRGYVESPRG